MPVYHFTWHAHGTWRPDHPRGYVERGKGYLPPDPDEAAWRDRNERHPRVAFDAEMQAVLIAGAHDACSRRGIRLHAAGTDPTHVHLVMSWLVFMDYGEVQDRLKNVLSLLLGRLKNQRGGKWFVGRGSRKRVRDRGHFEYLLTTYLPGHRGLFWKEGMPLPRIDPRILDPRGAGAEEPGAAAHGYDTSDTEGAAEDDEETPGPSDDDEPSS